jgi:1-acyl-sn-glycerol-3-phosphate acyltransferase
VKKLIAGMYLRLLGWRVVGTKPDFPKVVIALAPHTSNWDLPIGLAISFVLGVKLSWLGKRTLFRRPFGSFMRWLGGIPIDRSSPQNTVERLAIRFAESDALALAIPVEGTRGYRDYWKSGFFYIAERADVPIVLAFLDYPRRVGGLGPIVDPRDGIEVVMGQNREFYRDKLGRYPENVGRVRLRDESPRRAEGGGKRLPSRATAPPATGARLSEL